MFFIVPLSKKFQAKGKNYILGSYFPSRKIAVDLEFVDNESLTAFLFYKSYIFHFYNFFI